MLDTYSAIIMAAGRGTRMHSTTPKPLMQVAGRSMVEWLIDACAQAGVDEIIVVVNPHAVTGEYLRARSNKYPNMIVVNQEDRSGTGAAVLSVRGQVSHPSVFVLSADSPMVPASLLQELAQCRLESEAPGVLTECTGLDARGYGRVMRDADGAICQVAESKHTDGVAAAVLETHEVNVGVYLFDSELLFAALGKLQPDPVSGELLLTEVVESLYKAGQQIAGVQVDDVLVAASANTPQELEQLDKSARARHFGAAIIQAQENLAEAGASFNASPNYVRAMHLSNRGLQLDYLTGKSWATRYALRLERIDIPYVASDGSLSFESWQASPEVYRLERETEQAKGRARQDEIDRKRK